MTGDTHHRYRRGGAYLTPALALSWRGVVIQQSNFPSACDANDGAVVRDGKTFASLDQARY
ncbi:MAG: hypothetical protein ACTS85_00075 [Arsenophonus sp. NC-PG7-MAG3]